MLWFNTGLNSQMGMFLFYLLAYLLFNTSFTLVQVSYSAILPDLTDSYEERASIFGFRLTFPQAPRLLQVLSRR
ncbi:MAG: MFS transporter [Spirochaetia bacterium]